jgi:tripartite ATP-independent transporter DctM subunit
MELTILIGSFLLFIALGIPIAFSLALSSLLMGIILKIPVTLFFSTAFQGINNFIIMAVPFYLLSAQLMNYGGITERLLRFSDVLVGHIRGGLGYVNVLVSMLFSGISGAATADAAGIGAVIIPAMVKSGYDRGFSVALTAASSTMGVIIPPSLTMVLYGALGDVSIGALFLGGFIPGVLVAASQSVVTYFHARKRNYPKGRRATFPEIGRAFRNSIFTLGLPIVIVGGTAGGIFTATEAAVVAAVYALFLLLVIYRVPDLKISEIPKVFSETVVFYSTALFTVVAASSFGWFIAYLRGPEMMVSTVHAITDSYLGVFFAIVIIQLILGCVLASSVIIIVFISIFQALGNSVGIHPIHLGVVTIATLALGLITPPVGICLMIDASIGGISFGEAFKQSLVLFFAFIVIIVLCILFPDLVLFIPRTFMPNSV